MGPSSSGSEVFETTIAPLPPASALDVEVPSPSAAAQRGAMPAAMAAAVRAMRSPQRRRAGAGSRSGH